jgi:catechol 2,3-dioxygenase-like lactoylglutathione lyase family enzyme
MPVETLDHYTINTADVDASVSFYVEVLGLRLGERPPFTFPGAWLYCGESPVVHLVGGDHHEIAGTGSIDHVAFRASGIADYTARLEERGIRFRQREVPGMPLQQVFLEDPDGVTIELNFWQEAAV